jgi:hypothetical protein
MSVALVLNPTRPGTFRRTIRDDAGKAVRVAVFAPREPVVLTDDEFIAMADDVGHAVLYAEVSDKGEPTGKPAKDQGEPEDLKPKRKKK